MQRCSDNKFMNGFESAVGKKILNSLDLLREEESQADKQQGVKALGNYELFLDSLPAPAAK